MQRQDLHYYGLARARVASGQFVRALAVRWFAGVIDAVVDNTPDSCDRGRSNRFFSFLRSLFD